MKINSIIIVVLSLLIGLCGVITQGSTMVHIEDNIISYSDSESPQKEDGIYLNQESDFMSAALYFQCVADKMYQSPVMPVLTGPPKTFV